MSTGVNWLYAGVRSGSVNVANVGSDCDGTNPQGQLGLYAGTGSASVKIDDFEVLDTGRMKNIDGRWETNVGDISLVSNKLEFGTTLNMAKLAVRRGLRGSKYVIECDVPPAGETDNRFAVGRDVMAGSPTAFDHPVSVNSPFRGGCITLTHAAEMPWVQLELSRAPFMPNHEKRSRVEAAFRAWCDKFPS